MLKKSFTLLLCMLMVFALFSLPIQAAETGEFTYTVSDGTVTITGHTNRNVSVLEIPSTIDGNPVVAISQGAFKDFDDLTDVTIPDSVTKIGSSAFHGCSSLADIVIPGSVTVISHSTFSECPVLTQITFSEGIETIEPLAVWFCNNLKQVYLPKSLRNISSTSFFVSRSFLSIEVAADNPYYSSQDGVLFNKDKTILIKYPEAKSGSYVIPDTVTEIDDSAFIECEKLTDVTLPNGLKKIGDSSFSVCSRISSLTLPDSVTSIGDRAFGGCISLENVVFSSSLSRIPKESFANCKKLTSITLPNGITTIDDYAFSNCIALNEVVWPDTLETIGASAFDGCSALEEIVFPSLLQTIGDSAFQNCTALKSITLPESLTTVGARAFYNCSLPSIDIPSTIDTIEYGAFGFKKVDSKSVLIEGFFIRGIPFSSAETYAVSNNIPFVNQYTFFTDSATGCTLSFLEDGVDPEQAFLVDMTPADQNGSVIYTFLLQKEEQPIPLTHDAVLYLPVQEHFFPAFCDIYKINEDGTETLVEHTLRMNTNATSYFLLYPESLGQYKVVQGEIDFIAGDVNHDALINAKDALLVLKHAVEKTQLDEAQLQKADVNGDDLYNAKDALLILQKAVEKIDKFPIEMA